MARGPLVLGAEEPHFAGNWWWEFYSDGRARVTTTNALNDQVVQQLPEFSRLGAAFWAWWFPHWWDPVYGSGF